MTPKTKQAVEVLKKMQEERFTDYDNINDPRQKEHEALTHAISILEKLKERNIENYLNQSNVDAELYSLGIAQAILTHLEGTDD